MYSSRGRPAIRRQICNPALVGVIGDPLVQAIFDQSEKLEWFATLRVAWTQRKNREAR
jgi:hypothetical protein